MVSIIVCERQVHEELLHGLRAFLKEFARQDILADPRRWMHVGAKSAAENRDGPQR